MTVEMIFVGTELLLGNIVNTNAQYLSEQCAALGLSVYYQTVVGDNEERLLDIIENARKRADVILFSGGLGPTEDDMTKETVAKAAGLSLVMDEESRAHIEAYFAGIGRTISENNWKQAQIPEGSKALQNANGTAPGIIIEAEDCKMILLPGPPNELIPMFQNQVVPYLKRLSSDVICSAMVKVCGVGESAAEEKIKDMIDSQTNPTIATYAKLGEVHLRVTARAESEGAAQELIAPVVAELQERFGADVYTTEEERTLEDVVVGLLKKHGLTITTAESCTGGLAGSRLVSVSGASDVYHMGFITYCDDAKHKLLGVKKKILKKHTAVSEKTARKMAIGGAKAAQADVCIAITGYADPQSGTEECPAGTVFISCYAGGETEVQRLQLKGSRNKVREIAALKALDLARRQIEAKYQR